MIKSRKKIIFVHLLNDYSGSPLVLSQVINSLSEEEYEKILFTSTSSNSGFLSNLNGVETKTFWYSWSSNPWWRLITYSISQSILFFRLLSYWRKDVVIYVNTLLPFGAALAGKFMGKKVIYHVHETSMKPPLLKKFLRFVANSTANGILHVSNYLAQKENFPGTKNKVLYNTLSHEFVLESQKYLREAIPKDSFRVLMLCSLKKYKGVDDFFMLAHQMPSVNFELVLNATEEEVSEYVSIAGKPANLEVHSSQKNVHPFYQKSSLVLNLSHPDQWIETFGMTALEAMYYKLPVIVPTVGGIAEIVENGYNGFHLDYRSLNEMQEKIEELVINKSLYNTLSENAFKYAQKFNESEYRENLNGLVREFIQNSDPVQKSILLR